MSFNRLESEPNTSTSGEKAVKNHGIGPFAEFSRLLIILPAIRNYLGP
jgi:hypothetical protein